MKYRKQIAVESRRRKLIIANLKFDN